MLAEDFRLFEEVGVEAPAGVEDLDADEPELEKSELNVFREDAKEAIQLKGPTLG